MGERERELELQLAEARMTIRRLRRKLRGSYDYTFRLLDDVSFYREQLGTVVAVASPPCRGVFGRIPEHEEAVTR